MLKKTISDILDTAIKSLGYESSDIVLSIPQNPKFGDYSTNVALQLSKQDTQNGNQSTNSIANEIKSKIESMQDFGKLFSKIEVAGAGFINFYLIDEIITDSISRITVDQVKSEASLKYLVEYGHVNLLKEIHIGHLRTFILGESVCRLLESQGNSVFRANYQGDIGLHIAKAIWGIQKVGLPTAEINSEEKAQFLGTAYAAGNTAYDDDPSSKQEIDHINNRLYQKDKDLQTLYDLARSWSLEYFEPIYNLLGVKYDRCFFESEVAENGKQIVLENLGKVFEKNDGAIIFPGEKYDLHTRVFVTTAGNPTYEAKEIGLAKLEYETYPYDRSIHIVADEQTGYFQVVIKAIDLLFPELKGKKYHLAYGFVDLKGGKMSSRTGNVVTVDDLLKIVEEKVKEVMKKEGEEIDQTVSKIVAIGAIKFSYLKFSPRPNMIFDLEKSVSLSGDSGPYVQYSYARTQSILKKVTVSDNISVQKSTILTSEERAMLLRLDNFPDLVKVAAAEFRPNMICEYLLELAHYFNLFYQKERVIGSSNEGFRVILTEKVGESLKFGLNLLGIEAPERM